MKNKSSKVALTVAIFSATAALALLPVQAAAQETPQDVAAAAKEAAVNGHVADVVTTGVGLAVGAVEQNPLGLLALGVKLYAARQIEKAPVEQQPRLWSMWGAFGWAASTNNGCVIVSIVSGGSFAPACLLLGLTTGVVLWPKTTSFP